MRQSHWLLCVAKELWLVQKNHPTVKLDSSVAASGMKTYSESRIEFRNLQMLKKMLENGDSYCDHSSPVSWKAWKLPWILQELKKNTLGKLAVTVNAGGHSIRVLNERSVSNGENLYPLWLEILKSLWYSVGDTLYLRYSWLWAAARYNLFAAVPWNGLENTHRKARLCVYFNWFQVS